MLKTPNNDGSSVVEIWYEGRVIGEITERNNGKGILIRTKHQLEMVCNTKDNSGETIEVRINF